MSDVFSKYIGYCEEQLCGRPVDLCTVDFEGQRIKYVKISPSKDGLSSVQCKYRNLLLLLDMFQDIYEWVDVLRALCKEYNVNTIWIFTFKEVLPFIINDKNVSLLEFLDRKIFHCLDDMGELSYDIVTQGYCANELLRVGNVLNFNKMVLYEPFGITKLPYILRLPFLKFIPLFGQVIHKAKFYASELMNLIFCFWLFLALVILSQFSGFLHRAVYNVPKNLKNNWLRNLFIFIDRKIDHLHFLGNSMWTFREYVSDRYMFLFWSKDNVTLKSDSIMSTYIILGNESPNSFYDALILVGSPNIHVIENYKGIYHLFNPESMAKVISGLLDC